MRQLVSSGSPFEGEIGFPCGPFRAADRGFGTAPIRNGEVAGNDAYEQTKACLEIILKAVEQAGGKASDIVRTRIFLTDMSLWKDAARAHGEVFGEIRPASSFIGTSALINPAWLVEIEATAWVES